MLLHARQQPRHTGFSLVEILVGMVVGMLGIIVIMQMYSVFEQQKRTTTSGDDAQNSGAIALHGLQRDIQHSGYGISVLDLLGCKVTLRTGVALNAIAPVTIYPAGMINPPIPAGDANTDTLLVVHGNSNGSPQGDSIDSGSATNLTMENTPTALPGDYVIAESQGAIDTRPTAACSLFLEKSTAVDTTTKSVTIESHGVADGTLYNLGQAPKILAYAIRNGNLTVCKYVDIDPKTGVDNGKNCGDSSKTGDPSIWVPIASDIVSLRAQYGRDTATPTPSGRASYVVDAYDQNTPTTNCGWTRTPAVRIALVARGVVRGTVATTAAPLWAGSAGAPIDLSASTDGANWKRYHYKVFETTVPLRNIAWMGVQTGC